MFIHNSNINKNFSRFPFGGGKKNYQITPNADGSYSVKTKINYQFKYDPTTDPDSSSYAGDSVIPSDLRKTREQQQANFNSKVRRWQEIATNKMNEDAKKIKDPKVQFEVISCNTGEGSELSIKS